jgi:hypothetical protein
MSDTNQPAPKEPTIRIRFKPDVKSPKASITQGPYRRRFDRAEQPFEVTEGDWDAHLERTGLFEVVPEKKPAAQQGGQQQQTGQQQGGGQQQQ